MRNIKIHCLKTWPHLYKLIVHPNKYLRKTVDIRKDDRDFLTGDILILQEFNPENNQYTGYVAMSICNFDGGYLKTIRD
jgi:hypothetical protein